MADSRSTRRHGAALAFVALGVAAAFGCSTDSGSDASGTGGDSSAANGGKALTGGKASTGGADDGSGGARSGEGGSTASGGTASSSGGDTSTEGGDTGTGGGDTSTGGSGSGGKAGSGTGRAADGARKLGREPNFLIGMGNDLNNDHSQDGAYTLGVTMDIHYAYLVGLPGEGGWPDWNAGGTFVNILTDSAADQGTTPMFDIYTMASRGEANLEPLTDDSFMNPYWTTLELLYERLAEFDQPAIVHFEPDFWGFAQQASGGDPAAVPAHVTGLVAECDDLTDDLAGLGRCMVRLGRMLAPKAFLGFHASRWAGVPEDMVAFLNGVGAGEADFIGIDMLDRDAGCFEEHVDPNCQREDGPWYWDETNQSSPNFHEFLDFSREISDGLEVPIIWWQIPFGVPSDTPGGEAGNYRDNRVHYIFSHVQEFVDAGGLGAAFGTGAGNQTYITTDGGQFQDAVEAYYASPVPLP